MGFFNRLGNLSKGVIRAKLADMKGVDPNDPIAQYHDKLRRALLSGKISEREFEEKREALVARLAAEAEVADASSQRVTKDAKESPVAAKSTPSQSTPEVDPLGDEPLKRTLDDDGRDLEFDEADEPPVERTL